MPRFAFLLAVLSLGVAGWLFVEGQALRRDLDASQGETAALRADLAQLRRWVGQDAEGPPPPLRTEAAPVAAAEDPAAAPAAPAEAPRLLPVGASPEQIAKTVRDLQRELAAQREKVREVEEKVDQPGRRWRPPRFYRTVDEVASSLDLDPRQRADLERIVDYAKRDLEDLENLPNAEGKTLKAAREEMTTRLTSEGGDATAIVTTNRASLMEMQNSKIPGRDETYAQADRRIRDGAKKDARALLTPEQQKSWDEAVTDPLFGAQSVSSIQLVTTSSTSVPAVRVR